MLHALGDFISNNQLFSGLGGLALITLVTALVRYVRRRRANRPAPVKRWKAEVIPLWFEVSLNQAIPQVTIWVQVVNYLPAELTISRVVASYFHVNQGPPLENIPAPDYQVPSCQSREVTCRRTLIDSEIRSYQALPWSDRFTALLRMEMKATAGNKSITVDQLPPFNIRGHIGGLASHPSVKQAPA